MKLQSSAPSVISLSCEMSKHSMEMEMERVCVSLYKIAVVAEIILPSLFSQILPTFIAHFYESGNFKYFMNAALDYFHILLQSYLHAEKATNQIESAV